ncbi:MAG: alpha/beta fold hydrolase [Candidatus Didemnitutus sp.]|nr:alpha/beta fold hydrolase [Candidatus Didemnitutus sp.]
MAPLPDWLRAVYPFEPKRFATAGGTLSYLDEGPRSDEAVVMVHGNPTWSFFYRDVVQAVRPQMRCIVPDHLGCGLSDKPQAWNYTLPNHIANLTALLKSLQLKRIHLVVHDWGGPIGLGALLPQAEKLGRVVILNTAAFADTVVPWRIRLCRAPVIGELLVRGLNGFAWPATWMSVTKPLATDVKRGFLFPYDTWANRVATHRFVVDIPSGRGTASDQALAAIESNLPRLRDRPVEIIWGGADFCFNRHYFDRWAGLLPQAGQCYLDSAGHYLIEDEGPAVIQRIAGHLLKA